MELAQDRVKWRSLVLTVLNLRILLQASSLVWRKMFLFSLTSH